MNLNKTSTTQIHYKNMYLNAPISFYNNVKDKIGKEIRVADAILMIESENIDITENLRKIVDEDEKRNFKNKFFSAVIFSGICRPSRSSANLVEHSGLIVLDIDNLKQAILKELWELLTKDEYVFFMFTSPTGRGLKIVVKIDIIEAEADKVIKDHKQFFVELEQYFKETYNVTIDKSGSNVDRLCYLPYDENIHIFKKSTLWKHKVLETGTTEEAEELPKIDTTTINKIEKNIQHLEKKQIDLTKNYKDWINLGYSLANLGEAGREYFHRISKFYPKYNKDECDKKFTKLLETTNGNIKIATFFYYCKPYLEQLETTKTSKKGIAFGTKKTALEVIIETREVVKKQASEKIEFAKPIISNTEGIGLIYPNTINIIQGKKGVHKSRFTEEIVCRLLAKNKHDERLGLIVNNRQKYAVLYVDTERNINDQFPAAIQKIALKSGYEINSLPPALDYISLINVRRKLRLKGFREYVEKIRAQTKDHLFIVLDVIPDFILNFNNVEMSMNLIDMLNDMINHFDVTFLCVIHENPGLESAKGRGHLGTELNNKASQVMQIGFVKVKNENRSIIKLNFLHSRNTERPQPIYMAYSEADKGLVLADQDLVDEFLQANTNPSDVESVAATLGELLKDGEVMESNILIEDLASKLVCSKSTIKDRLRKIEQEKRIILKQESKDYYLKIEERPGRTTLYSLTIEK